jgi:hypothetical protein
MSNVNIEVLLQTHNEKDRLFTNNRLLSERLAEISRRRMGIPGQVALPDMEDIQVSHNTFITKEYIPFIAIGFLYRKAQQQPGSLGFNKTISYTLEHSGNFIGDTFFHLKTSSSNSADTGLASTVSRDMIRYSALPAAKIIKRVNLKLDNVVSSSFTRTDYVHYLNHELPKDKLKSMVHSLGNETRYEGELNPHPGFSEYRMLRKYGCGAQTYMVTHPGYSMYYPLLFWNSLNSDQVLVNRNIDRISIDVELDEVEFMIEKLGLGSDGVITYPTIDTLDLFYKDIYVSHEIHEIYIKTKHFEVISTWRTEEFPLNKAGDTVALNARNWPIERMYMSFVPDTTFSNLQKWFKGFELIQTDIPEITSVVNPLAPPTYLVDTVFSTIWKETLPLKELTIKTFSVTYFDKFDPDFFTKYETDFNEKIYTSPNGSMLVNFDYKPGYKNLTSGYSSTSNNTDFNIIYDSDYFSSINTGVLKISLRILDTLLIDVKLLELRFNTV